MKKYKKILIVTHQYLPHVSPRTTRWKLLIDELITKGHNVSILTGMYPDFDTNNVEVLYFGNKNNINIVSNLREKSKQITSGDSIKKLFYGVLKKVYKNINCYTSILTICKPPNNPMEIIGRRTYRQWT